MKLLKVVGSASCLIALAWCLQGCGERGSKGFGNKEISWGTREPGKTPIQGIDEAEVDFGTWGEGAALAVWSDRGCSLGASGMGGRELQPGEERKGVKYEGSIKGDGGSTWRIECQTPDGKTGRFTIGDECFDLKGGALFLVSTRGPTPKVKQLRLAALKVAPEGEIPVTKVTVESLQAIARIEGDIRSFFTAALE